MLGKRSRRPMRRTTSMTEFGFDVPAAAAFDAAQPPDHQPVHRERQRASTAEAVQKRFGGAGADLLEAAARHAAGSLSRGGNHRNSGDFTVVETAPFLRACGLCNRKLGPGRDTFMYRGEVAFCSLECRQQQMNLDERKEKCSVTSMKDAPAAAAAAGGSEQPGSSETVAAA